MGSLIVKGGWVMIPILLGSVVALTLVLERIWFFWRIRIDAESFSKKIFSLAKVGLLEEALGACESERAPLALVFRAGLERTGESSQEIERVMEREGNRQVQRLERNLGILLVVVGVEPLLGFLGTILGLIQAFMTWEKLSTSVTVSALAAGIYQAMITTAAGLIIAIPYFVAYHLLLGFVNRAAQDLNHYGDGLVSVLAKKELSSIR